MFAAMGGRPRPRAADAETSGLTRSVAEWPADDAAIRTACDRAGSPFERSTRAAFAHRLMQVNTQLQGG